MTERQLLNPLDRVIAAVAPSWGARRAAARLALDQARAYVAARPGRYEDGWYRPGTSANSEIRVGLVALRNAARDLSRNNPWAHRAVEILRNNSVGSGIVAKQPKPKSRAGRKIADAWSAFVDECDADGVADFYGLQSLIANTVFESGGCLVRRRWRRAADGLRVPVQLQVLETDFLDLSRDGPTPNGGFIVHGIEFDAIGNRVGYWMYPEHPGDNLMMLGSSLVSKRVPASEVLHIFERERAGQVSGVPRGCSAMLRLRQLDSYEEALLLKKKIEACFTVFVKRASNVTSPLTAAPSNPNAPGSPVVDASGKRIETLRPGIVMYGGSDLDVTFGQPSSTGGDDVFTGRQLLAIGAGYGVTYHQLTGDLSQANYSSMRGGLLDFRLGMDLFRQNTAIRQFCRPARAWAMEAAQLSGAITSAADDAGVSWTAPKWQPVDVLKEVQADLIEVRAGFQDWAEMVSARGLDPEEVLARTIEHNKAMDAGGVVFDSDPRKTNQKGLTQAQPAGSELPPADETQTAN